MLSMWVEELRQAKSAEEVVTFAARHLERVKAEGDAPLAVAHYRVGEAEDVREIAAALAHQPFMYNAPGFEGVADQQLLILFSLATDRLAQLEGRGLARPSNAPVNHAP